MSDPARPNRLSGGHVTVRYWAAARAAAGVESTWSPVGEGTTLADVLAAGARCTPDRARLAEVRRGLLGAGRRPAGRLAATRGRRARPRGHRGAAAAVRRRLTARRRDSLPQRGRFALLYKGHSDLSGHGCPARQDTSGRSVTSQGDRSEALLPVPCRGINPRRSWLGGHEPRSLGAGRRPRARHRRSASGARPATAGSAARTACRAADRTPPSSLPTASRTRHRWTASTTRSGSGPRCCSSPRRSARPAGRPAGSSADVAGLVPGVAHVEVDAEQHLDLVRRLGHRSARRPRWCSTRAAARSPGPAAPRPGTRCSPRSPARVSPDVRMMDDVSTSRDGRFRSAGTALRICGRMFSTMLTKRRAVDHCRVRSALCRMS